MDLASAWQLFISTPAGYIVLAFIAALLYIAYYAARRYFDERREDRAQRATEIDREAKDDERDSRAIEGMLAALTTTVSNQTEQTKAIKEQADATRALSETTALMQQAFTTGLEGLAAAMGKAMYQHEESAKGRHEGIINRIDALETTVRQLITDLAEAQTQNEQEHNRCLDEIAGDIKAMIDELRQLRAEFIALPDEHESDESGEDPQGETT